MLAVDYSSPLVRVAAGTVGQVFASRPRVAHHVGHHHDGGLEGAHPRLSVVHVQAWTDELRSAYYARLGVRLRLRFTLGRLTRDLRCDLSAGSVGYAVLADSIDVLIDATDAPADVWAEAAVVPSANVEGVPRVARFTSTPATWAAAGSQSFNVPQGAAEVAILLDTYIAPAGHACQFQWLDAAGQACGDFSIGNENDAGAAARIPVPNAASVLYCKTNHTGGDRLVAPVFFLPL